MGESPLLSVGLPDNCSRLLSWLAWYPSRSGLCYRGSSRCLHLSRAFLIWLARATYEARRDEQRRGYEHRREVYLKLLDTILMKFGQTKSAKAMPDGVMVTKLCEVSNQLFLEASDSVYKSFRRMLECAKAQEAASNDCERQMSSMQSIHGLGCFMLAMRKDIGFKKTGLTEQDYLRQLLSDYEVHSKTLQSLDCEE